MLARRSLLDIWAPCPITQNGVLRIMSQPPYPNHRPVVLVAERLEVACNHASHVFWPEHWLVVYGHTPTQVVTNDPWCKPDLIHGTTLNAKGMGLRFSQQSSADQVFHLCCTLTAGGVAEGCSPLFFDHYRTVSVRSGRLMP